MKVIVVTKENFTSLLPSILHHIKDASFISFDTELTGLTMSSYSKYGYYDEIEDRYKKLRDSANNFGLLQFGLCAWKWKSDAKGGKYANTAWSFHLFPPLGVGSEYRRWTLQLGSIAFLRDHGFDFNKTFRDGISYLSLQEESELRAKEAVKRSNSSMMEKEIHLGEDDRLWLDEMVTIVQSWFDAGHEQPLVLPECSSFRRLLLYQTLPKTFGINMAIKKTADNGLFLQMTSEEERKQAEEDAIREFERNVTEMVGFRRIIDYILRSGKLLVGHNCWLDLMHFYSKFIGNLPIIWEEFLKSWESLGLRFFDTKHIARQLIQEKLLKITPEDDTSLGTLAAKVDDPLEWGVKVYCDGGKVKKGSHHSITQGGNNLHDAGFDAYCTGKVFIGLITLLATRHNNMEIDMMVKKLLNDDLNYINRVFMMKSDYNSIGVTLQRGALQNRPDRSNVLVITDWPATAEIQPSHINSILKEVAGLDRSAYMQHWLDSRTVFIELVNWGILGTIFGVQKLRLDGKAEIPLRLLSFSQWKEQQQQQQQQQVVNEEAVGLYKKKSRY